MAQQDEKLPEKWALGVIILIACVSSLKKRNSPSSQAPSSPMTSSMPAPVNSGVPAGTPS